MGRRQGTYRNRQVVHARRLHTDIIISVSGVDDLRSRVAHGPVIGSLREMAADRLSPAEHAALSDLIASEWARTAAQIEGLARDFDGIGEWSETPPDDEHDPEGATLAFERAQVTALLRHARIRLVDLERSLELLSNGQYGYCRECGHRVAFERLMARPTAHTCVLCAAGPPPRRRG